MERLSSPSRGRVSALAALLMLFIYGIEAAAEPVPSAGEKVRVGIYQNCPKVFWGGDGKPQGIYVDLVDEIARAEGWRIEYVKGEWDENLKRLEAGELDLMVDVTYSEERERRYDLNKISVIESWLQVFTLGDKRVERVQDLDGKRIAVLVGSVQAEYLDREVGNMFNIRYTIKNYPDYSGTVEALKKGEADLIVATRFFYFSDLRDKEIVPTPVLFRPGSVFFAFPKGRKAGLIDAVDRNLSRLKNDPGSAYYRSLYHWLGERPQPFIPRRVKYLIAAAIGLLVLIGVFAVLLKLEVNAKTGAIRASEDKYRKIYEGIAEGVYRTSPEGRVLMANPALVRLLGYRDLEHLRDLDVSREGYIDPAARDEFRRRIERDGEVRDFTSTWRRVDGTELIVSENARAVRDGQGKVMYYEGTIEDITERTRADLALLDEKNKLARLFDISLDVARAGTVQEMLDRTAGGLNDLGLFGRMVLIIKDRQGRNERLCHFGLSDDDLLMVRRAPPAPPRELKGMLEREHRICNSYYLPFDQQRPVQLLTLTHEGGKPGGDWRPGDSLVIPLTAKSGMIGYLAALDPADGRVPTVEIVRLLELYANQAATAIDNLRLYNDLEVSYYDTLRAFVAAMEAKDPYTKGHSENVQRFAVMLARHLGLAEDRIKLISHSALLHDIGKLGVSESILIKPDTLTEAEYEEVKRHPLAGSQMVARIENLVESAPIIHSHHEYFDGNGYPEGISGSRIPLESRIIAVADAFEAMTSDRPYRKAFPSAEAIKRLREFSGRQFDQAVVEAFVEISGQLAGER